MAILLLILTAFNAKLSPPARRTLPPPARTACEIVTRIDVEGAIGRAMGAGEESNQNGTSTCDYTAKDGGMVSITIQRLTGKPDLRVEMAAMQKEVPESVVREVAGLDDAFYLDVPGAGTQLHIVSGSTAHVMVSILGLGEAPQVARPAAEIARKALKRL